MNQLFASCSRLLLRNSKTNVITSLHQKVQYYSKKHQEDVSRLLLGEGDLNYAESIREKGATKMVATCLDSEEDVKRVYPKAKMHIMRLRKAGATCLFGVNVHHLLSHVGTKKKYEEIVFNFPEAIEQPTEEEASDAHKEEARLDRNKSLLRGIFENSKQVLKPKGSIQVILQDTQDWKIDDIAKQCGLKISKRTPFFQKHFPDYTPLKGAGTKPEERLDFGASTVYEIVRPEDFNLY